MGCSISNSRDVRQNAHGDPRRASGSTAQRPLAINVEQSPAPRPPPPRTRTSASIDSATALRKIPVVKAFASLHSATMTEHYLVLKLDATSSLEATVYVDGSESVDEDSGIPIITAAHQHESAVMRGMDQLLSIGPLGQCGPEPPTGGFSIGLLLRNPSSMPEDVSRMYWFGVVLPDTEVQWTQQKVVRGSKTHQADALFGSPKPDVTDGDECVICLTNPKEVVILHCRHVCLCQACSTMTSSTWSYQCPVCRGRVSAMCAVADS